MAALPDNENKEQLFVPVGPAYEEKWAVGGKHMEICDNGITAQIKKNTSEYGTAFGTKIIGKDELCEWTLQVTRHDKRNSPIWCYIGIAWSKNWDISDSKTDEKEDNGMNVSKVLDKYTLYN